jgi:hypothetical protein
VQYDFCLLLMRRAIRVQATILRELLSEKEGHFLVVNLSEVQNDDEEGEE